MIDQHECDECETPREEGPPATASSQHTTLRVTLLALGLTATAAVVTFILVRNSLEQKERPSDPTTDRIKSLLAEANSLIKQLDEHKR